MKGELEQVQLSNFALDAYKLVDLDLNSVIEVPVPLLFQLKQLMKFSALS